MHLRLRRRSARRPTPEEEVRNDIPEASPHAPRAAVGTAPRPGAELGWRPCVGGGCADAAPPLPDPRLGGRLVLRIRMEPDAREHACGRAGRARGRRTCGRGDRPYLA